ncbi:hypothetical protein [Aquisalibacillus elongatus]|uniref:Aminopeptidase n=1 Tax=Aquisalibacillus elongatus TaxID=485577 RepID=A0A3N5BT18_9BACI|nr:hypothetical protein [Aquisalibacillus elongatus]RPF50642.1 hypothetical protein EDC24_2611 [Aquisalibacillus elongatus]
MKVIDTVQFFKEHYKPELSFLETYHNQYPEIFKEYFTYHCPKTDERLSKALDQYSLSHIEKVRENIHPIIDEVNRRYAELYGVTFPIGVNLIVGCFGSNAYTHRAYVPDVTFALERLSSNPAHLRVIVAHEFGHAAHHIITDEVGIDWEQMNWSSPLIWLTQEGVATHMSKQIVQDLHPSVYFSYNEEGHEWLAFAEENQNHIKQAFREDYERLETKDLFKEWFSIRGGEHFGYNRLAYYLADLFFQEQVQTQGEMDAVLAWREPDYFKRVEQWLYS